MPSRLPLAPIYFALPVSRNLYYHAANYRLRDCYLIAILIYDARQPPIHRHFPTAETDFQASWPTHDASPRR